MGTKFSEERTASIFKVEMWVVPENGGSVFLQIRLHREFKGPQDEFHFFEGVVYFAMALISENTECLMV
jgi:hypothetical protein